MGRVLSGGVFGCDMMMLGISMNLAERSIAFGPDWLAGRGVALKEGADELP
jgi:hypothetical protein